MARQNVALCLLLATLICFFLQREKEAGLYVRCIQDTQQILQIDLTKSGLKVFGSQDVSITLRPKFTKNQ
mgnify:CR=1 FL=1